jgi:hypothetical protein
LATPSSAASSAAAAATFVKSASFAMCSTSSSLFIWPLLCQFRRYCDAARVSAAVGPKPALARLGESTPEVNPLLANRPRKIKA